MKKRIIIVIFSVILVIAYLDVIDSCRRIDSAISRAVKIENTVYNKNYTYSQIIKSIID